jgi:hypothetical protein
LFAASGSSRSARMPAIVPSRVSKRLTVWLMRLGDDRLVAGVACR